uniref:FYVE-type domain-containing protein n=1 Tax=Leersia perrieri TaxID=77586 RepID=A0A0D9VHN8_9ORYZ
MPLLITFLFNVPAAKSSVRKDASDDGVVEDGEDEMGQVHLHDGERAFFVHVTMLEKIGLPPKPSLRGASWVVDATHCQGCSVQFSLFTRKHHCQRCGGLFCSNCTQQRMVLRGQGDSPVRICDPCKKLEEAARYEMRYGHKNRASKANVKAASNTEDDILSEILGGDGVQTKFSRRESLDPELPGASSSSSSSRRTSGAFSMDGNGDGNLSIEAQNYELNNTGSIFTPEELRQQAVEEKKKYKTLKSGGKPEEALRAFKHGKELERQAAALELELRKNRRMATKAPNVSAVVSTKNLEVSDEAESKKSLPGKRVRKEKNDLASELRDLGWSDADLHDETRPTAMSVEGELSQILREVAPKSEGSKTGSIDKSQVNALKRQALLLKRQGKLAEAKEELKKAKILERQLEEQEILGEADESDDDLAALIRNMDDGNQDDILLDNPRFPDFNFEQLLGTSDDLPINGNFDVTDDDLNDPDMAAALKSFGWSEADEIQMESHAPVSSLNQEALREQVLALKREAVTHMKAGNVAEAMSLLRKAKLLEKDLETEQSDSKVPSPQGHRNTHTEDLSATEMSARSVSAPKSKLTIQRELLALKKKALALRREGKVDEAEEELKKGSVLEKQLEDLENSSARPAAKENRSIGSTPPYKVEPPSLDLADEGYEPEVTDNDMQDPALLSVLKNMGWEDDDGDSVSRINKPSNTSHTVSQKPTKSKGQIQKELLAIKRKALAFRREGKNTEAEEELEKAKVLEQQLSEMEESGNLTATQQSASTAGQQIKEIKSSPDTSAHPSKQRNAMEGVVSFPVHLAELGASMDAQANSQSIPPTIPRPDHASKVHSEGTHSTLSRPSFTDPLVTAERLHSPSDVQDQKEPQNSHGHDTLKDEILLHKRKAVAFKREGKLAEAREELKQAKLLEKRLEVSQENSTNVRDESMKSIVQESHLIQQSAIANSHADDIPSAAPAQEIKSVQPPKALSSRDRLKIQRESLAHKRNALKLRREGKTAEADAEFELAKSLESQLEESDSQVSGGKSSDANDAAVEDLLDPQIMSALKSIGWSDADLSGQPSSAQPSKKAEAKPTVAAATSKPQSEKTQLEEQIKAEKLKALSLKREGKQTEALEALRSAKRLEKKLASL